MADQPAVDPPPESEMDGLALVLALQAALDQLHNSTITVNYRPDPELLRRYRARGR